MTTWAKQLAYTKADYDSGRFSFGYEIDGRPLEIMLEHTRRSRLTDRAIRKIGFHLGLCYLLDLAEIVLPDRISVFQALPPEQLAYWQHLYRNVVVEKCYVAKAPTARKNAVWQTGTTPADTELFQPAAKQDHVALSLTGGKESLAILKTLQGKYPLLLFFLNPEMNIHRRRVLEHVKGRFETVNTISNRTELFKPLIAKYQGLSSGVDMAHLVFNTMLYSDTCSAVLLGNEYSANFPNTVYEGAIVNHQYVKTIAFAEDLNNYIRRFVTKDFSYHSPFFGLYEYRIADLLFQDDEYLDLWTSCNRTTDTVNFCCNCHKCAFTYLIARTKKSATQLGHIFSRDLLEDVGLFRPLMDFTGVKPLDCVGDKTEVWVALENLREQGIKSPVGDYYDAHIRPAIAAELEAFKQLVTSEHRTPLPLPAELKAIFATALTKHKK